MAGFAKALCDAIKGEVEATLGAVLPPDAVVQVANLLDFDALSWTKLHVVISPRLLDVANISRSKVEHEFRIGVWIGKRATTESDQWAVVEVAEEVARVLHGSSLGADVAGALGGSVSVAITASSVEIGSEDGLNEHNIMKATTELTCKVVEA